MKKRWNLYEKWQNTVEDGEVWKGDKPNPPDFNFTYCRASGVAPVIKIMNKCANQESSVNTMEVLTESEYKNTLKDQNIIVNKYIRKFNLKWKGKYEPIKAGNRIDLRSAINFLGDDLEERYYRSKDILFWLEDKIGQPESEYSDENLQCKLLNEGLNNNNNNDMSENKPTIVSETKEDEDEDENKNLFSNKPTLREACWNDLENEETIEYPRKVKQQTVNNDRKCMNYDSSANQESILLSNQTNDTKNLSKRETKAINHEKKYNKKLESDSEYEDQTMITNLKNNSRKERKQQRLKEKTKRILKDSVKKFGFDYERSWLEKLKCDAKPIKRGFYSDHDNDRIDLFWHGPEGLIQKLKNVSNSQKEIKRETMEKGLSVYDDDEYTFEQKSALLRKDIYQNKELSENLKNWFRKISDMVEDLADSIDTEEKYNKELLKFKEVLRKAKGIKTRSRSNKKVNQSFWTSARNKSRGNLKRAAKSLYFGFNENYDNIIQDQIELTDWSKKKAKETKRNKEKRYHQE